MAGIIGIPIAAGIFVAVPVGVLIFFAKRRNKKTLENRRTIRSEDSGLPPITPLTGSKVNVLFKQLSLNPAFNMNHII